MTENKKKKKNIGGTVTVGMGNPVLNMKQFNKDVFPSVDDEIDNENNVENSSVGQEAGIVAANAGNASALGADTGASAGEGDGGGMSEELLHEKRETKRYYIRPQDIFCANKADVLKALIEVSEAGENCSVYTLKNLDDHDDVHELTNNDIIYYYDNDVLYDKNHVMVMDYDLFIKHEEERKNLGKSPATITKSEYDQEYDDRMTKNTFVEDLQGKINYNALKLAIDRGEEVELGSANSHADSYFGADYDNGGRFSDGGTYGDTTYVAYLDNGKYCLAWTDFSDDGDEGQSDIEEYNSFEDLVSAILNIEFIFSNLDLDNFAKHADKETGEENLTESAITEGRRKADEVLAKDLNIEIIKNGDGTIKLKCTNIQKLTLLDQEARSQVKSRAIKAIKTIKKDLKSGELSLKDLESEVRAYVTADKKVFDSNSYDELEVNQKIAYYEALIRKYFEKKLATVNSDNKKKNRTLDLHDQKNRNILDLAPTQIDEAKNWLQEHVTNIVFKFPKVDDDVALFTGDDKLDQKDATIRARWDRTMEIFKDTYPNAIEGKDYTYRIAGKESDTNYTFWNPTATVTFDVAVETAPQSIKTMIDRAKDMVVDATHVSTKNAEQIADKNAVNSIYFAEAALRLFNNDLNFYKNKPSNSTPAESKDEDPFNQTFESYDIYGNKLNEAKEDEPKVCCICGEEYEGYGNNAEPYKTGYCCDACQIKFVLPARLADINKNKDQKDNE